MARIIRLAESDITRLVKRVIKENVSDRLRIRAIYQKIMRCVKNGDIQKHELKNLDELKQYAEREASKMRTSITDDEIEYGLYPLFHGNLEIGDYEYPESDWR